MVGGLLAGLGAPRLVGALGGLPGNAAWQVLERGDRSALTTADLEVLLDTRATTVAWTSDEVARYQLGVAYAELAQIDQVAAATRQERLENAAEQLRLSLKAAPADPLAWLHLAYVELLAAGPNEAVAAAVVNSMQTGRYQPEIIVSRLQIGLAAWRAMSEAQRRVVGDQIDLLWSYKPWQVARLGLQPRYARIVDALMADDFEHYRQQKEWARWAIKKERAKDATD